MNTHNLCNFADLMMNDLFFYGDKVFRKSSHLWANPIIVDETGTILNDGISCWFEPDWRVNLIKWGPNYENHRASSRSQFREEAITAVKDPRKNRVIEISGIYGEVVEAPKTMCHARMALILLTNSIEIWGERVYITKSIQKRKDGNWWTLISETVDQHGHHVMFQRVVMS